MGEVLAQAQELEEGLRQGTGQGPQSVTVLEHLRLRVMVRGEARLEVERKG